MKRLLWIVFVLGGITVEAWEGQEPVSDYACSMNIPDYEPAGTDGGDLARGPFNLQ